MARSGSEQRRASRRRRVGQGLAAGALAFGLPALANAVIARRAARLPSRAPLDEGWSEHFWHAPPGAVAWHQRGPGDGEPVLFLHSLGPGHSSHQWRDAAEHLSHTHRTVLVDHLGFGGSDRPNISYGLEASCQLLSDFIDHAIRQPFHLVASGESSPIALALATTESPILTLALSGPAGIRLDSSDETGATRRFTERSFDLLLAAPILGTSAVNAYARRSAIENSLFRHLIAPPTEAHLDESYRLAHLPGSEHALSAFLRGQFEAPLEGFELPPSLPLWIGWGRKAVGEPVEDADLWLGRFPQADLAVFESAASWPHVDQPADFAGEYQRFLRGAQS